MSVHCHKSVSPSPPSVVPLNCEVQLHTSPPLMSSSGAAIVAVLRPVPFPKCAQATMQPIPTHIMWPSRDGSYFEVFSSIFSKLCSVLTTLLLWCSGVQIGSLQVKINCIENSPGFLFRLEICTFSHAEHASPFFPQ